MRILKLIIKNFEEVCPTFQEGIASIDLMRLTLFLFTLKDKTKSVVEFFETSKYPLMVGTTS